MTTKKEVSPSPPRNSSSDDYILVAVLLVILQLAHELRFGWLETAAYVGIYILADTLVRVIRRKRGKK